MSDAAHADGIGQLKVPEPVRAELRQFLAEIMGMYQEDLISVTAFGSCVTGDYAEGVSDINLLVVYSDLNIADLHAVSNLAKHWLRKKNIAPRFLSRRNLLGSAAYFQIDMLEMRDAHVVLFGEDLLKDAIIRPERLHWQLSYEIKAMRMRIKQQFWQMSGDPLKMRRVFVARFTSLIHLSRTLLFLMKKETPVSHRAVMARACSEFGISPSVVDEMFRFKYAQEKLDQEEALKAFGEMMEIIRVIDQLAEQVRL